MKRTSIKNGILLLSSLTLSLWIVAVAPAAYARPVFGLANTIVAGLDNKRTNPVTRTARPRRPKLDPNNQPKKLPRDKGGGLDYSEEVEECILERRKYNRGEIWKCLYLDRGASVEEKIKPLK